MQDVHPGQRSDADLIHAVTAGDRPALAELYDRHAATVYGMALAVLRDASLAQDATQEVFMRLWTRGHTFDDRRGTVTGWLASVARNVALDELRRQRRASARAERLADFLPLQAEDQPDLLAHSGWQSDQVLEALSELSTLQRQTVELVYLQGYSLTESATRLGVAPGTVKSRLHSALVSLRAALGDETRAAGQAGLQARE